MEEIMNPNYLYNATLVKVVDGDTVDLNVDLGFYNTAKIRFRFTGMDAPEVRGESRVEGKRSKEYVIDKLTHAKRIRVVSEKTGKWGRWLGTIYYDNGDGLINLNESMVTEGYAVEYKS